MAMSGSGRLGVAGIVVILSAWFGSTAAICETCSNKWTKIYEGDSKGNAVMGKLVVLHSLLAKGNPARYVVPTWGLGYAAPLGDLTQVWMGGTIRLCSQSLMHITKAQWNQFPKNAAWRLLVVCTNGVFQEVLFDFVLRRVVGTNKGVVGIQWFVKKSSCEPPIYVNSDNGTDVIGYKKQLTDAVHKAYDITIHTVKVPLFSTVRLNNVAVSQSEVVSGQSIWQITSRFVVDHFELIVPLTFSYKIYSTTGKVDVSSWRVGQHTLVSHTSTQEPVTWFIDPCWQYVYTNDENGKELEGSLDYLIAAVEAGHRVKVVMGNYSIETASARTARGHVSAQLLDQLSRRDIQTFTDDVAWVWQMVHTTGAVRTRTYPVGSAISSGIRVEKKVIRWFIDARTWTKVLSTNKNGDVQFGSKSELRSAIQRGAAVRLVWRVIKPDRGRRRRRRGKHSGSKRRHKTYKHKQSGGKSKKNKNKSKPPHSHKHKHSGPKHDHSGPKPPRPGKGTTSYWYHTRKTPGWLSMAAENVELGPNGEVAAQFIRSVSAEPVNRDEFQIKARSPAWRLMTVSTQSDVHVSQWTVGSLVNTAPISETADVNWFVSY